MIARKNTKILVAILFGIMSITLACKSGEKMPKEAIEYEKAELQAEKEAEDEYRAAIKHHLEIQSKQTKENAKLLKKQQKQVNKSKKRSLWDRLFNNKCDKPVDGAS
jgi:hypothetical protein